MNCVPTRISLCLLVLFCFSCADGPAGPGGPYPRKIVPQPEGVSSSQPLTGQTDLESESYLQMPKIALFPYEKLIQVLTTNLDQDEANEQVIMIKRTDDATSPVRMIIADFSNADHEYVRAYETELAVTDERTVRIDVSDVIGNNTLQIVVSGMNAATQATLDAFRLVSPTDAVLVYRPFCHLVSPGTIEIDESDSAGYSGGHRYGTSFPIIVFHTDPATSELSSVIKETYTYNYAVQAYTLQKSESVKTDVAAESRLAALLQNSTPELLKKFIKGIWYNADDAGRGDEKILSFDPESEDVAFYSQDVQEVYQWKYTRRSFFNTLQIYTESALLKSVQPNITVVLHSPDELSIAVTEYSNMEQSLNEEWGGTYVRLDQAEMLKREQAAVGSSRLADSFLKGDYVTPDGDTLSFTYPRFSWRDDKRAREGGFAVVEFQSADATQYLLELKIIEDQGLSTTDLFYIVQTTDVLKTGSPLSSFTLKPARTSVYGIVDTKGQPLHFTRRGS